MKSLFGLLALLTVGASATAQTAAESAARSVKVNVLDYVAVAPGIVLLKLALLNPSKWWLSDINIRCEFLNAKGEIADQYRHSVKGTVAPGKALLANKAFAGLSRSAEDARCIATSADGASPI